MNSKAMSVRSEIKPAAGRLGILLPGMGAVATTFVAGVEAVRRSRALPIGSLTQLGHIRLGKRTDDRNPMIKELVPLAELDQLVFGGWDPIPDNAYESARNATRAFERRSRTVSRNPQRASCPCRQCSTRITCASWTVRT